MPKSAKFIYPRKVRVVIGEALHPNVPAGEGSRIPRSAIAAQSAALRAELQRLFRHVDGGGGLVVPTGVISRPECNERLSDVTGSSTPQSSRAECIESCGTPTSMVSIPRRVAVIGPIVDPHGMLFFEENTWVERPPVRRWLRIAERSLMMSLAD